MLWIKKNEKQPRIVRFALHSALVYCICRIGLVHFASKFLKEAHLQKKERSIPRKKQVLRSFEHVCISCEMRYRCHFVQFSNLYFVGFAHLVSVLSFTFLLWSLWFYAFMVLMVI